MPKLKLKTHSGAKGRIRFSGGGKILRRKSHINNYRRKKRRAVRAEFHTLQPVHKGLRKRMRRLLPYGGV